MNNKIPARKIDDEAAKIKNEENDLFVQNFRLIYKSADKIISTPEYFHCECKTAYLSTFYIGRGGKIPLGVLLLLWREAKLIEKCPTCGKAVFVFGEGGSPLSGAYSWWGFCPECDRERYGTGDAFRWQPIYEQIKKHSSKPQITAVTLKELVEVLQSNEL